MKKSIIFSKHSAILGISFLSVALPQSHFHASSSMLPSLAAINHRWSTWYLLPAVCSGLCAFWMYKSYKQEAALSALTRIKTFEALSDWVCTHRASKSSSLQMPYVLERAQEHEAQKIISTIKDIVHYGIPSFGSERGLMSLEKCFSYLNERFTRTLPAELNHLKKYNIDVDRQIRAIQERVMSQLRGVVEHGFEALCRDLDRALRETQNRIYLRAALERLSLHKINLERKREEVFTSMFRLGGKDALLWLGAGYTRYEVAINRYENLIQELLEKNRAECAQLFETEAGQLLRAAPAEKIRKTVAERVKKSLADVLTEPQAEYSRCLVSAAFRGSSDGGMDIMRSKVAVRYCAITLLGALEEQDADQFLPESELRQLRDLRRDHNEYPRDELVPLGSNREEGQILYYLLSVEQASIWQNYVHQKLPYLSLQERCLARLQKQLEKDIIACPILIKYGTETFATYVPARLEAAMLSQQLHIDSFDLRLALWNIVEPIANTPESIRHDRHPLLDGQAAIYCIKLPANGKSYSCDQHLKYDYPSWYRFARVNNLDYDGLRKLPIAFYDDGAAVETYMIDLMVR